MEIATILESKIDKVLSAYVNGTSAAMSGYAGTIAAVGLTIYIIYMSYASARGDLQEPLSKITKDIVKIALVLTVALGGGAYQQFVINFANGIISDLAGVVTSGTASSVGGAIDNANTGCVSLPSHPECVAYESVFLTMSLDNANGFGIPAIGYFVAFILVGIAQFLITVLCLLPILLAKVGMAIMLGIGPIFVLLALFPITFKYFEAWLSSVVGFVLTQIIVAAVCSVIPMIFKELLVHAINGNTEGSVSVISDAFAILIAGLGLGFTALHASQKGAQLAGGGTAMDSKGLGGMVTQALLNRIIQGPNRDSSTNEESTKSNSENSASETPRAGYRVGNAAGNVVGNILSALEKRK